MSKRDKFFSDLAADNHLAALLMAQVGGMPGELQLVVQTAALEDDSDALRPLNSYVIRALSVQEHQLATFGMTVEQVEIKHQHPLLYQYNSPAAAVFFKGQPNDVNDLTLDIAQTHASMFGQWRHFPLYLNVEQPLVSLLQSGGGLLGQMPKPFADELVTLLEKQGLETKVMLGKAEAEKHSSVGELKALLLGESYIIAYDFSFDELGKV